MMILRFALVLLLSLAVVSCNRAPQSDGSAKPRVAFVMKTLNNPFFVRMREGAEAAAKTHNIDLIVQAPEREIDVERQMQIVENLIQADVDALCITPSGSREIVPAIKKANEAGIPVLIVDTKVDEATAKEAGIHIATFIGSDNYQGGRLAGEYYAKKFHEKTQVTVLSGIPGHETADSRLRGFQDAVKEAPHIEVAAVQPANSERDLGYNVFQSMLQSHPDIRGLFATNDMMALGAIEAISAANKTGQVDVIGFDAIDESREAIRKGTMTGSVAQFPDEMGRVAVETAAAVITGASVPESLPVKIELITKDNVDGEK